MDNIGLDMHKRESQLCILTEDGEVIERRIVTSRERFTTVLGGRPRARILLEASTGFRATRAGPGTPASRPLSAGRCLAARHCTP